MGSLFLTGFFAAILPRLSTHETFSRCYVLELIGAILALATIAVCQNWYGLLILFWIFLTTAICLAFKSPILKVAAVVLSTGMSAAYPALDKFATEKYYAHYWQYKLPEVLETCYSPYQRIDIIRDTTGKVLLLDGLTYFDSNELSWFNYYMAKLPATLIRSTGSRKALVFGSGSFSSTRMLRECGFDVTTVELDQDVARLGLKHFAKSEDGTNLVIDDARRFITTQPEQTYDIVVLDIPAPHHIQTALLYTPGFFRQVKRCLKPEGVMTVSNCGSQFNDLVSLPITAGVTETFGDVMAVTGNSADTTTLYASTKLPFDEKLIRDRLNNDEKQGYLIFNDARLRNLTQEIKPNSEDDLRALILFAKAALPGNRQ